MLCKWLLALTLIAGALLGNAQSPAPRQSAPMGVYLSWEIPVALAERNGVPLQDFLEKLFALCQERHVNYLWVTNLPWDRLPELRELAAKYGMELQANCCDGKLDVYYQNDAAELRDNIQHMVRNAGTDPNFTGWVLSDEPLVTDGKKLQLFADLLRDADPQRAVGIVITPPVWKILADVKVDFAAIDAYPFFAPGDPNGPHTATTSIAYYRSSLNNFVKACRAAEIKPWGMPQSFVEILGGPYRYNDAGEVIALPGSYFHWRMPTVPEIRWQFFEALRLGMQGICFFELAPVMPWNDTSSTLQVPEAFPWRDALLTEEANAGFGGLTTPWGTTTPQFDEIGDLYHEIQPYLSIIARWQPIDYAVNWSDCPVNFFFDPATEKTYAVLANDDLEHERQVHLQWTGGAIPEFTLPPGGGRIVEVPTPGTP